jgi:PAS domain S-box-containing protein
MKPSVFWKNLAVAASLAAIYFAFGKLGLMFSLMRPSITPVWPPSGIAVAGLLVFGYRVWPGIFLGALAIELTTPCGLGTAFGVAVGNTLESLAAAWLANRFAGGRDFFMHPLSVLKFAVLVGVISPLISPPLGVRILSADRFIVWGGGGSAWLIWWLGDMVSLLVVAPLLVVWAVDPWWRWNRWKTLEFGLLILLLAAVGEAAFGGWTPASARDYLFSYLCLPFLFWAAFRFGQRETMTATFALGTVVMWGSLHGYGLFERVGPDKALLVYQGFMATTSVMIMALAAVVDQRQRAGEELQEKSRYARGLIEASLDPMVTISSEGRITDVNRATEFITGAERNRLIGSDFSEYFTEPEKAKEGYREVIREGQVRDYPLTLRHKSGRTSDVLYNAAVFRSEAGEAQGVLATARDITQRNALAQVIRRSEARYRSLVTATAQIIWTTNAEGQVVDDTPTWRQYSGQSFADASGSGWFNAIHPEDREQARALWAKALQTQTPFETECRLRRRDGEYQHFVVRAVPVLESEGNICEWISTGSDVTERKHVQAELEQYRRHLEALVRQRTSQLEAANTELQREIVERKRAEEALRESEYRYAKAQQAANIGSWDWNIQTGQLHWSEQIEPMFGFAPGQFDRTYEAFLNYVHPEDRPIVTESVDAAIQGRRDYAIEHRIVWPDGTVRWVAEAGEVQRDAKGAPTRMLGIVRDITERKRMQQALESANEELQTANKKLHAFTEELRGSNETLERRVAERTENLRQTNRILRMISECNQALVHVSDQQELIQRICHIIHEIGGYRMAWVGFGENDRTRTVRPIAAVGFEEGYLQKAKITWADNKFGRGPTGTAIRTRKVCTANDFLSDPELAPWRKLALERGFRSSIALPLLAEGRAFGALTIYAADPAAFDPNQIEFLTELADDLSFGITALHTQAERDRGRKELERKAAQLRALAGELAYAEQRERRRLAQILHDRLQQLLVGARYNLELLRKQSEANTFQETVTRIDGFLDECIKTSRSLTAELSPPILYEAGLAAALKWLGRWFWETHGLTVRVIADEQSLPDSEELRVTLFQAVRELLFNVVKHAKVKQAEVRLSRPAKDQVKILVSDKGAGFELATLQALEGKAGGFGLFSLRERLESLGGQLEVDSAPGRGSRFVLSVTSEMAASKHPAADAKQSIGPISAQLSQ